MNKAFHSLGFVISLLLAFMLVHVNFALSKTEIDQKANGQQDEVVENRSVQLIRRLELNRNDKSLSGSSITLAQNSKGDLFLVKDFPPKILVFSKEGEFQFSFGEKGNDPGKLHRPFGVAIDNQDMVYISDIKRGKILVFTPFGDFVDEFSSQSALSKDDKNLSATGCISIDKKKNRLYITDAANGHIWIHDLKGNFLQYFKGKKSGLCTPGTARFDAQGRVYVPECVCNRIRVFEEDGREILQVGKGSGDLAGQFSRLNSIDIDSKKRLYAVDILLRCVQVFSPEGNFIGAIKYLEDEEGEQIYFKRLVHVYIGLDDHIFIVDQGADQVYIAKDNNTV